MTAIISGNTLGLIPTSAGLPGSPGVVGQAATGPANEDIYVNVANGNLVIQDTDEVLVGQGLDDDILRTYNSQAQVGADNNDNDWQMGVYQRIYNLTGTVNTAGSTVTRTAGDGSDIVYTYNAGLGGYVNSRGSAVFGVLDRKSTL